jgi:hypothetical protein
MNGQRVGRIGRRRILNGGNVFAGANIKGSVEGDCIVRHHRRKRTVKSHA